MCHSKEFLILYIKNRSFETVSRGNIPVYFIILEYFVRQCVVCDLLITNTYIYIYIYISMYTHTYLYLYIYTLDVLHPPNTM